MHDWLKSWPALALACGLPLDKQGRPRIPSPSQQCKRRHAAGAPVHESLFVLVVLQASDGDSLELVISSLIVLPSWPGDDVILMLLTDMLLLTILSLSYEASACTPSSVVVLAYLSSFCSLLPTHTMPLLHNVLLAGAVHLYQIRPRIVRLDAAYWGLRLIAWIHAVLGAVAVIPWNPKNQKNRSCLPPTWTREELGKRSSIERFFGRVFLFFISNVHLCVVGPRSFRRWP